MIPKIVRGSGFGGVLRYAMQESKHAEIVSSNMLAIDAKTLAREFRAVAEERDDIERPVWHVSLSLTPGETLTAVNWDKLTRVFLNRMGFPEDAAFVAIRHHDTEHEHVHIIASRVNPDRSIFYGQRDVKKAIEVCRELEREYGLKPPASTAPRETRRLKKNEIEKALREGREAPRNKAQRILDDVLKQRPKTTSEFALMACAFGMTVRANIASTGRLNGFSFEVEGISFKGSDLGKKYTLKSLLNKGITYEQDRDRATLERLAITAVVQSRSGNSSASIRAAIECAESRRSSGQIRSVQSSSIVADGRNAKRMGEASNVVSSRDARSQNLVRQANNGGAEGDRRTRNNGIALHQRDQTTGGYSRVGEKNTMGIDDVTSDAGNFNVRSAVVKNYLTEGHRNVSRIRHITQQGISGISAAQSPRRILFTQCLDERGESTRSDRLQPMPARVMGYRRSLATVLDDERQRAGIRADERARQLGSHNAYLYVLRQMQAWKNYCLSRLSDAIGRRSASGADGGRRADSEESTLSRILQSGAGAADERGNDLRDVLEHRLGADRAADILKKLDEKRQEQEALQARPFRGQSRR